MPQPARARTSLKEDHHENDRQRPTGRLVRHHYKDWRTAPLPQGPLLGSLGEYHERWFYDPSQRRNAEYIEAIKLGRVLISPYKTNGTRQGTRNGYLNYIYTVTNVRHDEDGLRCRIVAKEAA